MKYVNVSSPLVYRDSFPFDATAHETLADSMFDMVAEHGVATTVEIGGRSTANLYGIKGHLMPHHHVTCEVFNNWLEQKLIYLRQLGSTRTFPCSCPTHGIMNTTEVTGLMNMLTVLV